MSTTDEIKSAIRNLPREERRNIASWVIGTDEKEWDEEIQNDVSSGILDGLAEQALKDHKEKKTREL